MIMDRASRIAVVAVLAVALLALLIAIESRVFAQGDTFKVRRLEIVDSSGHAQIILASGTPPIATFLTSTGGKRMSIITADGGPVVFIWEPGKAEPVMAFPQSR